MYSKEVLAMLNILLAFVAVPPSLYLVAALMRDKAVIKTKQKLLNSVLTLMVAGFAIGSIVNAVVSTLSLVGLGAIAHEVARVRSVYVNAFFSTMSWLFYYIRRTHE